MTRRRLSGWALAAVVAGGLAWVYRSDRLMLERPDGLVRHYRAELVRKLAAREGMAHYLTFDEAQPVDWVSGRTLMHRGCALIAGRFGGARRFSGTDQDAFTSITSWRALGPSFTISLWLRPEPGGARRQVVLGHSLDHDQGGLWYEEGRLTAAVCTATNLTQVTCPLPPGSDFVHVAMVADAAQGQLRLQVAGQAPVHAALPPIPRRGGSLELARNHQLAPSHFFCGAVDELVILRRALNSAEVADLAGATRSRRAAWAGRVARKLDVSVWAAASLRFLLMAGDLFNPAVHLDRIPRSLPEVRISASNADLRQFALAQKRVLEQGLRDGALGGRRRVTALADGRGGPAWLAVRAVDSAEGPAREVWRIEFEDGRAGWLVPPERCDLVAPLAAAASAGRAQRPAPATRLCALILNNRFQGTYVWQQGVWPGVDPEAQHAYLRAAALSFPDASNQFAHAFAEAAPALLNDTRSPWSRREIRAQYRRALAAIPASPPEAAQLSAFALLGSNPAPYFVTRPLNLPVQHPDGTPMAWQSDHPEILDHHGLVRSDAVTKPVQVALRAGGADTSAPPVIVRVMPRHAPLPAVFLEVDRPISASARVEAMARIIRPGSSDMRASRPTSIKWRGKTGLFQEKKSYSLRFEEPPGWIPGSPSRFVCLMACALDPSYLRDRLAHDLFRDFGGVDHPRPAVQGDAVELFVNGSYQGIYSMTERVDRDLVGWGDYAPGEPQPLMFRAYEPPAGFARADGDGYLQEEPSPDVRAPDLGPLCELLTLTSDASSDEVFRREIARMVDLPCFMDYFLLLNVLDNRDGEHWNFYLARDAQPGARWHIIPWDWDMTLRGTVSDRSNALFDRLARTVPDYLPALRVRWRELRRGPLSEAALDQRLAGMEGPVMAVAEWDWQRWSNPGRGPRAWANLRAALAARIARLDGQLGYLSTEALSAGPPG